MGDSSGASSAIAWAAYPPNRSRPVGAAGPRSHDATEPCFYSESRSVRLPIHTPSPWLAAGDNRCSAPVENSGSHSAPPNHWKYFARSPDRTLAPVRTLPVACGDSPVARPARAQTVCCDGPDILLAKNDSPLRAFNWSTECWRSDQSLAGRVAAFSKIFRSSSASSLPMAA